MPRCGAPTEDGTPCLRRIKTTDERCYQHRQPKVAPLGTRTPSSPPRRKIALALSLVAVATVGAVTITTTWSGASSGGSTLTVQAKADVTRVVTALSALGFRDAAHSISYNGTDCKTAATNEVRQFFIRHPCKEYASAIVTNSSHGITTKVAISWVTMPTPSLASQYKALADTFGTGNPPGQPLTFDGHCYASGQDGTTVWAEQVEPTGQVYADRKILQAAAPVTLSSSELQRCIR